MAYSLRLEASMIWRNFALKRCAWAKVCPMVTSIKSRVLGVKSKLLFVGMMPPIKVMRSVRLRVFLIFHSSRYGKLDSSQVVGIPALVGNFDEFLSDF